jgi:hypothetical protein
MVTFIQNILMTVLMLISTGVVQYGFRPSAFGQTSSKWSRGMEVGEKRQIRHKFEFPPQEVSDGQVIQEYHAR